MGILTKAQVQGYQSDPGARVIGLEGTDLLVDLEGAAPIQALHLEIGQLVKNLHL